MSTYSDRSPLTTGQRKTMPNADNAGRNYRMQIIDADGHINDHACGEEIAAHMPKVNQLTKPFPEFDHLHFRYLKQNRRANGNPSSEDSNQSLHNTESSSTVLYPTTGLAVERII